MNWHIYPCGILSQGLYYICSTPSPIMTTISLTSGEVLDIISALCDKEQALYDADNLHLAAYYLHIIQQFENISHRLEELPGEERVANLVMAL
jgi:hypothetical protein